MFRTSSFTISRWPGGGVPFLQLLQAGAADNFSSVVKTMFPIKKINQVLAQEALIAAGLVFGSKP